MCKYKENACNANPRGFSQSDVKEAIKMINTERQNVANGHEWGLPTASNMKQVEWDDELAAIAQRYTDQCEYKYDQNYRSKKYKFVGMTFYMFRCASPNNKLKFDSAVNSWYKPFEVDAYNKSHINPFVPNIRTAFYTQVLWAESNAVGCGYSFFLKENRNWKYIACVFGPGGNIPGGTMYKIGNPCNDCPKICSKQFPGLCN